MGLPRPGWRLGRPVPCFCEEIYPPSLFDQYRETLIAPAGTVTDKNLKRFIILAEKTKGFNVEPQIDKIQSPILALGVF